MELSPELLRCKADEVAEIQESHLRRHVEGMRRSGAAVGISGGLDSSAAAALCVRALGRENVHGLVLTERQGPPEADHYAGMIADHLGIQTKTLDISPVLRKLGVYRFITSLVPSRKLAGKMVRSYMRSYPGNPYLDHKKGVDKPLIHRGFSMLDTKHRVRLVYACRYAEARNYLLVGSAQKTESMLGMYVKYGIDDCADVMPLGGLYRSHILQLAHYLGLPKEIINRPPSPDVLPGIDDKYRDVLGLDSRTVDLVLAGLEEEMEHGEIARRLGIDAGITAEIAELVERTYHMRSHSMAPDIPRRLLFSG